MPTSNQEKNLQAMPDRLPAGRQGRQARPPVVAIVGHVDHGKTTLLDYIRKTRVATKEAGGITQSIGAYEVEHTGKKITFIDTPGHEAFSLMRARGAAAADLAILVVAADDGVKPQTKEAIQILTKTKTPFIVAITKIDSPGANIDKVTRELLNEEVLLEGYGGAVSWHGVSGKTGEGVPDLLELVLLTGEVTGLTFDKGAKASGFVIESKMDNRRGVVAHIILKDGTLRYGDPIFTPTTSGKVKILENFLGRPVKELSPSAPALVVGLDSLPRAGEEFQAGERETPKIEIMPAVKAVAETDKPSLRVTLKADTAGSLEALEQVLGGLIEAKAASVGEISDGDVQFAKSTESVIVGFQVLPSKSAVRLADAQQVKIITSDVIYKLVEAVQEALAGEKEEAARAALEVLAIFSASGAKRTVGGKVTEGTLRVGNNIEVERETEVVGRGKITSLKREKESVREAPAGNECGLVVESSSGIEVGDILRVI